MDDRLTVLLLTILLLSVTRSSQALSGCEERGERLISRNRTLAPLTLVQASDEITFLTSFSGAKENIYNFGDHGDMLETWCTLNSDAEHYIVMGFTSPVLITAMVSSGFTDERFSNVRYYYVSNFTLEYAPSLDDSANFTYYLDEDSSPKYFEVPEINSLIRFERPLVVQQLRLTAVDWVFPDGTSLLYVCQGIALYGCLYTQDSGSTTDNAVETTTTISTQAVTTEDSPMTDSGPTALGQVVVVRDYQAVGIALPIAFITVIICGALVAVGVYMCYVISKRQKQGETRRYENLDSSVKTLERTPSEMEHAYANADSRKKSITKILNNPIYGVGTGGPDSQLELVTHTEEEHIYTSASETGYEPVDLNAEKREMETEGDDMIDNSAYGEVEVHPQHDTQDDETTAVDLKQNACYDGSTPATPLPDEGEYAYAIVESGQQKHGH